MADQDYRRLHVFPEFGSTDIGAALLSTGNGDALFSPEQKVFEFSKKVLFFHIVRDIIIIFFFLPNV